MNWESVMEVVEDYINKDIPSMTLKKFFRSKFCLPELKSYKSKPDQEYWDKWPSLSWKEAQEM